MSEVIDFLFDVLALDFATEIMVYWEETKENIYKINVPFATKKASGNILVWTDSEKGFGFGIKGDFTGGSYEGLLQLIFENKKRIKQMYRNGKVEMDILITKSDDDVYFDDNRYVYLILHPQLVLIFRKTCETKNRDCFTSHTNKRRAIIKTEGEEVTIRITHTDCEKCKFTFEDITDLSDERYDFMSAILRRE